MPCELAFRAVDSDRPISTRELYRQLLDALETSGILDGSAGKLVLSEVGIVVSLAFDKDGNPVKAKADISINTRSKYVSLLCWVFRDAGWVIGGG